MGNAEPIFVAYNVQVSAPRSYHQNPSCLPAARPGSTRSWLVGRGLGLGTGCRARGIEEGSVVHFAYKLRENVHPSLAAWNSRSPTCLRPVEVYATRLFRYVRGSGWVRQDHSGSPSARVVRSKWKDSDRDAPPGGTAMGDSIRTLLLDSRTKNLSSLAELGLMFSDRARSIAEVIGPGSSAGTSCFAIGLPIRPRPIRAAGAS